MIRPEDLDERQEITATLCTSTDDDELLPSTIVFTMSDGLVKRLRHTKNVLHILNHSQTHASYKVLGLAVLKIPYEPTEYDPVVLDIDFDYRLHILLYEDGQMYLIVEHKTRYFEAEYSLSLEV
jgi:hypothetical protein